MSPLLVPVRKNVSTSILSQVGLCWELEFQAGSQWLSRKIVTVFQRVVGTECLPTAGFLRKTDEWTENENIPLLLGWKLVLKHV